MLALFIEGGVGGEGRLRLELITAHKIITSDTRRQLQKDNQRWTQLQRNATKESTVDQTGNCPFKATHLFNSVGLTMNSVVMESSPDLMRLAAHLTPASNSIEIELSCCPACFIVSIWFCSWRRV